MTDLDFQPPPPRPAPDELRQRISGELKQASRRRHPVRLLVAAVTVLILGGVGVGVAQHSSRQSQPSAPGPLGSLDVRRLSGPEAESQLAACVANIGNDPSSTDDDGLRAATWKVRYARVQHVRGSRPGDAQASTVLVAKSKAGVLRCLDGNAEVDQPGLPLVPSAQDPGTATAPLDREVPELQCSGAATPASTPPMLLLQVGGGVRTAQVRVVVDRKPGAWSTAGADHGYVNLPILERHDFSRLQGASQVSYQVQALDAHGSTVPIASLGSRQQGDQTYTQQLATCADQRGQGERPVSEAAGLAECRRLVSIEHPEVADESRYGPLAVFADQNRFLAVLGSRTNPAATPFLCSLFPQRAVKGLSNGTPDGRGGRAAVNKDQLFFSLTARAKAGVSLWAGGRLDEPVSSITYTFPDGHRAQATISGDYWVLTYRTDRPLLDSRPMTELPPVEVDVITAARKRIHYTIPFTAETACDQEFPQRDC